MTAAVSKTRKVAAALVAAVAIGAAVAPTSANARDGRHHHRHGYGYGYGAAALGGGLLLGALAASAAYADDRDCWIEKRRVYDAYGDVYIRRIRVCD